MNFLKLNILRIIAEYAGAEPLSGYLKKFFSANRKLGSRDRRVISDAVYCYYRCAKGLPNKGDTLDKVLDCLWLCGRLPSLQLLTGSPERQPPKFDVDRIFDYDVDLSEGINKLDWQTNMLGQPNVFLRLIKESKAKALELLSSHNVRFEIVSEHCISVSNGVSVEKILPPGYYAVQDHSSQRTGDFFDVAPAQRWLDCCSGAGGKALMLMSREKGVELTVCDIRPYILQNLRKRFQQYDLKMPEAKVVDMSVPQAVSSAFPQKQFDRIICDVPCSGSGTWARTPEQCYFFDLNSLSALYSLQSKILANAWQLLKPGGELYYITCSVFKCENEGVVSSTIKNGKIVSSTLLNGLLHGADSLYISVLRK